MADESGAAPYPVRMARPEILAGTPAIRCLVSVRNIVIAFSHRRMSLKTGVGAF